MQKQGRIDEAIAKLEAGVRLQPQLYALHGLLGNCWREKDAPQKALLEYDKAIALQPGDTELIQGRRALLVQLGLAEEVRGEWEQTLEAGAAGYDAWSGYAELCLYLNHQDPYERACHDLLERFEKSNDPGVCGPTSRACLLGHLGPEDTARAVALAESAVRSEPTPAEARPYLLVAQGLARYRQENFDGAVNAIQGEALHAQGPLPHLVLSMAHRRAGRTDEAYRSLAMAIRGYDWAPSAVDSQEAWVNHILRRQAEPLVLSNLAALLARQDEPRSPYERLALAAVCESTRRTARAATLYADAFKKAPALSRLWRYAAACCAARAGCGDGEDAAQLSETERAESREQARIWLRDDLNANKGLLAGAPSSERAALPGKLETWFEDPALAGVRDEGKLRKLPSAERENWIRLWHDAESLRGEARTAISKSVQSKPSVAK